MTRVDRKITAEVHRFLYHPRMNPSEDAADRIADVLERDAGAMVQRWVERAGADQPDADAQRRAVMVDELPEQIRALARAMRSGTTHNDEMLAFATRHGEQRWRVGWSLVEVVRDYQILRAVLIEHLTARLGPPRADHLSAGLMLHDALDRYVSQAVEQYTAHQQSALEQERQSLAARVAAQSAELRDLALRLTEAELRERQRLAKVLHDGLQQYLVACKMKLQSLHKIEAARIAADRALALLDEAIEASRDLTVELHPAVLENQGLVAGVRWLAQRLEARAELTVTLEERGTPEPSDPAVRLLLFECVRELLLNVVKHAGVGEARVTLSGCGQGDGEPDGGLRIVVVDEGRGMEADGGDTSGTGWGLASLRQRLRLLDGRLSVRSEPGKGTTVTIDTPVEADC